MRVATALAGVALLAGCASQAPVAAEPAPEHAAIQADIRRLADEVERIHPNAFHTRPRAEWRAAVDDLVARVPELRRTELLVELMRLANLGPRDGHGGLYPFGDHARPLHLLPLRLWSFPEGIFVVGSLSHSDLVGLRLVSIEGRPAAELAERVRPLVAADNEWSRELRVPEFLITAEVLDGLGLADGTEPLDVVLERRGGGLVERTLAPVPATRYVGEVVGDYHELWWPPVPPGVPTPAWQQERSTPKRLRMLDRGTVVYAAYTMATGSTRGFAIDLLRRAKATKVRRVIVDARLNGGGDNTTYDPLLEALRDPAVNRPGRLVLLTSRITFSAGANFVGEVDRRTRARLIGEPSGGSANSWGDRASVTLPSLGWTVDVAAQDVRVVPGDTRAVVPVDVAVPLTAADFFAGRDPVLARALRR